MDSCYTYCTNVYLTTQNVEISILPLIKHTVQASTAKIAKAFLVLESGECANGIAVNCHGIVPNRVVR